MSRVGKNPINIPTGVEVSLNGQEITVKGPKGELKKSFLDNVSFKKEDSTIVAEISGRSKFDRSYYGTARQLVNNMVLGVTEGFSKKLKLVGVGFKAMDKGDKIEMALGYSHPVIIPKRSDIQYDIKETEVVVSGIDKEVVGRVAADFKSKRIPDRYKGKGFWYEGEKKKLREGKK